LTELLDGDGVWVVGLGDEPAGLVLAGGQDTEARLTGFWGFAPRVRNLPTYGKRFRR